VLLDVAGTDDSGIADVTLAGKGISISVEIEAVMNRRDKVFRVSTLVSQELCGKDITNLQTKDVTVELDTLTFKIRDSKHDLLYKFVKTVATGVIKKAIIAGFSAGIRAGLNEVHEQLLQVRNTVSNSFATTAGF
jgi:intracellular sulfur oxidation DsrE/DsrF family protein